MYTSVTGETERFTVFNYNSPGVALAMYNTDESIVNFAHSCFQVKFQVHFSVVFICLYRCSALQYLHGKQLKLLILFLRNLVQLSVYAGSLAEEITFIFFHQEHDIKEV